MPILYQKKGKTPEVASSKKAPIKQKTPSLEELKARYGDKVLKEQEAKKIRDAKIKRLDKKNRALSNQRMDKAPVKTNKK